MQSCDSVKIEMFKTTCIVYRWLYEFFSAEKADDEEGANVIATKFLSRMTLNSGFRIS